MTSAFSWQNSLSLCSENTDSRIVNVLNVYNMTGQRITVNDINELNTSVYILQGLTSDGRLVNQKVMVDRK